MDTNTKQTSKTKYLERFTEFVKNNVTTERKKSVVTASSQLQHNAIITTFKFI